MARVCRSTFLTFRLRFIQRYIGKAIKLSVQRSQEGQGDVSQFGALTTALAATIGTGNIVGVAVFDHPDNPRHPTWWHVRDYGLFAANPFGRHDFEKLTDKSAGDLKVAAGQSVTFRYRFYLHEGTERDGNVAAKYAEYTKSAR